MASKVIKRPSSARRNIKQECFSPYVSCTRLRRIQSLLNTNTTGDDGTPDALLVVLGIDSKYNEGSLEVANYLLFNFFDSRRVELERSGFAEEVIDDMMFMIRPNSVDVYCNPINYHYLLPYVAHWKNLHFHCLRDEMYEDNEEKAEEFKIKSLIAMADGCKQIGIPYSTSSQHISEKFDVMTVEKWPVVQAFALEGMGGGCFFTMKYSVIDISRSLHQIYNLMDPVALESTVTEHLPLFERQWNTLLSNIDMSVNNQCSKITEAMVSEPLQSYFNHGRLGSAKGARSRQNVRAPFVLFGTHTRKEYMDKSQSTGNISSDALLVDTATPGGERAQHMICQAVSPRGPICCRRTYFFTHAVEPYPLSENQGSEELTNFEKSDVRILQLVYHACIDAVEAAIKCYAQTLSVAKAEGIARQMLVESCDKTRPRIRPRHLVGKETVQFTLNAYNNQNSIVPIEEGITNHLVKTLCVTVHDIPSQEHPGQTMGSVSYADSFLESTVRIQKPDERIDLDGRSLLLTGHVPRILSWPCGAENDAVHWLEKHARESAITNTSALGKTLVCGEKAQLVDNSSLNEGSLYIYEHGLIYLHPHQAPVVLPKEELSGLHFYDGNTSSVVALLILTYKEGVRPHLPVHLRSPNHQIVFAFRPKSKVYQALYTKVLSVWKETDAAPKLSVLEELPQELQDVHSGLQSAHTFLSLLNPSHLETASVKLPELHGFLPHYECGSVSSIPIPSKHLPVVIGAEWDAGHYSDTAEQLVLTLIAGPPGGYKEAVYQSVRKMADFILLPLHSEDSPDQFQPSLLHKALSNAWKKRTPHGTSRGLLLVPGLTNTVDVIESILTHPDKSLAAKLRIGAVTVCIEPQAAYMTDQYLLPTLLDLCAQGWVNNVVFSADPNAPPSKDLEHLQSLVRATNSDVALFLANKGKVTRSTDLEVVLSQTAFEETALLKARYLSCPGWHCGKFESGGSRPVLEETVVRFSRPLDKTRFASKLKNMRASLSKVFPFSGSIYHIRGNVYFTECGEQCFSVQYSSVIEDWNLDGCSHPVSNGAYPKSFVAFYGCQLEEKKLKDWLRQCAPPKPEKRVKRTRSSLNKTEIKRIHKEHHLDSLPEGWFYNGSKFVFIDGEKSDTHPRLEEFLEEYLEEVNKEVDVFNTNIDKSNFHDLFEE